MGGGAVMISELVDGSAWTMPPVDGCWATPRAPPPLLPRPEDEPMPMDAVPLESRETTGCEVGMEDMPPPCGVVPPAPGWPLAVPAAVAWAPMAARKVAASATASAFLR